MNWEDELSVTCPMHECAQPRGKMCVYTTAPAGSGHEMGQETKVPHRERRRIGRIIRDRRAEAWRLEMLADQALRARAAAAPDYTGPLGRVLMVLGYNPDERAALRRWLAAYGDILTEAAKDPAPLSPGRVLPW